MPDNWLRFPFGETIPLWIEKYLDGKKILEIGSGNGILAEWLQNKGCEVLCLDPSPEMARRCKARDLSVLQTTIQEYEPKEPFDAILAICSLLHVPKADCPAQLAKIASCLKSGGTFFVALIEGDGEGIEEDQLHYPRFFAKYRKEEILALLNKDFQLLDFSSGTRNDRIYLLFALKRL